MSQLEKWRVFALFLWVALSGGVSCTEDIEATDEVEQEVPAWLFTVSSPRATLTGPVKINETGEFYELRLESLPPGVLAFTDRPERDVRRVDLEDLLSMWDAENPFNQDHPNAVLEVAGAHRSANLTVIVLDSVLSRSSSSATFLVHEGSPEDHSITSADKNHDALGLLSLEASRATLFIDSVLLPVDETSSSACPPAPQPYLDQTYSYLESLVPAGQNLSYQVARGAFPAEKSFVIPMPGVACWGQPACLNPGAGLLKRINEVIAGAQRKVDITGMTGLPSGGFDEALTTGLGTAMKNAALAGRDLPKIRMLYGSPPVTGTKESPRLKHEDLQGWLSTLLGKVEALSGVEASQIPITVGAATTDGDAFSWNHSKIMVVDDRTTLFGGVDWHNDAYLLPGLAGYPAIGLDLQIDGDFASAASDFIDHLWETLCQTQFETHIADHFEVVSTEFPAGPFVGSGFCVPGELASWWPASVSPPWNSCDDRFLALGGLGYGITPERHLDGAELLSPDQTITGEPNVGGQTEPHEYYSAAQCSHLPSDRVNTDADYDAQNPWRPGVRYLVSLATESVMFYQQDLWGLCGHGSFYNEGISDFDVRLLQVIAEKLDAGVRVRIVVSSPDAANGASSNTFLSGVHSTRLTDQLLVMMSGTEGEKRASLCANLEFGTASLGFYNGSAYPARSHAKFVMVDDQAFYVGSGNSYPSNLQQFGAIIDNAEAAARVKTDFAEPGWRHAKKIIDPGAGFCPY